MAPPLSWVTETGLRSGRHDRHQADIAVPPACSLRGQKWDPEISVRSPSSDPSQQWYEVGSTIIPCLQMKTVDL